MIFNEKTLRNTAQSLLKRKTESENRLRLCLRRKSLAAGTAAVAVARRGKNTGKRTVLVKAEKQSDDNGKTATAKHVRAEDTVLRAENKQCDKDPKGYVVTLITTSHKKPPVFCRRGYVKFLKSACGF